MKNQKGLYLSLIQPRPLGSRTTSALSNARMIDDLNSVQYPPNIRAPNPNLNINSLPGKYRYDRIFLMQFMNICKERPENLSESDAKIGMDMTRDDKKKSKTSRKHDRTITTSTLSKAHIINDLSSVYLNSVNVYKERPENLFEFDAMTDMSYLRHDRTITTSALSNARIINDLSSVQDPSNVKAPNPNLNINSLPGKCNYDRTFLMQFMNICKERPENLSESDAIIGMDVTKDDEKKSRESRRRREKNEYQLSQTEGQEKITSFEPIEVPGVANPIPRTSNELFKSKLLRRAVVNVKKISQDKTTFRALDEFMPIEVVQRKVKALLNKLALANFDSISDQIIDYANKSRFERDGRIIKEIIRLIFEKFVDGPAFIQTYAQLCRKMMERVDIEIVDENVKNSKGKFIQGATLFRRYLLNRCREDFEKSWKLNLPIPSNEKGEPDIMSDEYYIAKAKRRGLGFILFIGELFKLNMLTERIIHQYIKKFLTVHGVPEEEEMEGLCKLMTTVGQQLDHAKAKTHMDAYFLRMDDMSRNTKLPSRIRFMIMDVIDLRNNNWVPRRDNNNI
ncbi:27391_t:CDS:2 [Racocetra persica]|uniref:27391_t:CDS:1 n=1 Tax=Racocetra persica TaxID=160502 RepID=A0ACA9MJQ0_9GLOM|nr:27391_t:CDS:2 [Racocetra persica]